MRQQVNLYQPIFRKQRIIFSAQTIAWVSVGFLLLLLIWQLLVGQQVAHMEAQYQQRLDEEARLSKKFTSMRREVPNGASELDERIARLETRRQQLRQTKQFIRERTPSDQVELRPRLKALARHHPDGLWLKGVEIADNGRHMQLRGMVLATGLVPAYLHSLSTEPAITGLDFRQIRLQARSQDESGIAFFVSTAAEKEKEKENPSQ